MDKSIFAEKVILAPMSGYNTPAFLSVAADCGCGMAYTGLISCAGLVRDSIRTTSLVQPPPNGMTLIVQLFCGDPGLAAEAAAIVESWRFPSGIDINMGCPVRKVLKTGGGAELMRAPVKAAELVRRTAAAVSLPVTVKLRSGWDSNSINVVEMARVCVDAGAAAVTVHPRTRPQGYSGRADWSLIAEVKRAVDAPVLGSGDIVAPEDAARMREETGCDSVMIGRAALADPSILGRAAEFLSTGRAPQLPTFEARLEILRTLMRRQLEYKSGLRGLKQIRKFFASMTKGLPGSAALRGELIKAKTPERVEALLAARLEGAAPPCPQQPCGPNEMRGEY